MRQIDIDKLFQLVTPYLVKNDFGVAHTKRVFNIAKQNFPVKLELQELTYTSIIMHDIGGSSIKDQYEKGPHISKTILKKLDCPNFFIRQVCEIVSTHHEHPGNPRNHSEYSPTLINWLCSPQKNIPIIMQNWALTGIKLLYSFTLRKYRN